MDQAPAVSFIKVTTLHATAYLRARIKLRPPVGDTLRSQNRHVYSVLRWPRGEKRKHKFENTNENSTTNIQIQLVNYVIIEYHEVSVISIFLHSLSLQNAENDSPGRHLQVAPLPYHSFKVIKLCLVANDTSNDKHTLSKGSLCFPITASHLSGT